MQPLDPDPPRVFRTATGQTYFRRDPPRSLSAWARASVVATPAGDRVLVELPGALLEPDLVAADHRARPNPHVLTLREVGVLAEDGPAASPYRGSGAASSQARHYALFPAVSGCSLARSLAAARGGRSASSSVVLSLAIELAAALADTQDLGALEPASIVVSTGGHAYVRGALLEHIARRLEPTPLVAARPRLSYLAPEMVRSGPPAKMDARGRLFALGLMLTELATGREVLPESPLAARLLADWSPERPELSFEGPGELRAALWGLLHRDPDRRPEPAMLLALLGPRYAPGVDTAKALGIVQESRSPYL